MNLHSRFPLILLWVAGLGALLLPSSRISLAAAQERKPSQEPDARLILGTVTSEREASAAVPLYFQPEKNTHARSLRLELDFVSNSMKFGKAEKGVASQVQDYDLTVNAEELPPDDKNITRTRIKLAFSIADPDPQKSLPGGLLAFLEFKVPSDAKPFSIALNPITISAQDASKKPVQVAGEAGRVIVSVPDAPLVACFFFSH